MLNLLAQIVAIHSFDYDSCIDSCSLSSSRNLPGYDLLAVVDHWLSYKLAMILLVSTGYDWLCGVCLSAMLFFPCVCLLARLSSMYDCSMNLPLVN